MLEKPCPALDEIGAADGSRAFAPAAEKRDRRAISFCVVDRTQGAVVVSNNPINFTDPTGEWIWLQQLAQRLAATPAGQWAARQATAASQAVQRYGQRAWQAIRNYLQRGQVPCPPPQTASNIQVSFGHGARHLQGTGLSPQAVQNAITQQIQTISQSASQTGSFWGNVQVGGQTIQYRAFTLPGGGINVGTYYPVP